MVANEFEPGVTVWVCKQFEFVIRPVNTMFKTARQNTVNQSENEYMVRQLYWQLAVYSAQ